MDLATPRFTPAQMQAATSPDTALIVEGYPYGFRLRCTMRVWIEYKPGKGFRYCTQTTNPKKPGTVWNSPKASTYCRVASVIAQDPNTGHLSHAALTEYSSLADYSAFNEAHHENLCDEARKSLQFFWDVKGAYEDKRAELGVDNIFNATPEQKKACQMAYLEVVARHVKAGTSY